MAVHIDSGPVEAENFLRHVPREKWRDLMLARRYFLEVHLSYDCRCLVQFVNDAKEMFGPLGFESAEHMIEEGYGLKPEEIAVAVEWLTLNPPAEPISLDVVKRLAAHGGDRRSEKARADQACNTRLKYGTRAYWLARLDRDGHTELAAKVRAGKLTANAAAEEIGYRKQLTSLEKIQKLWKKLNAKERREHLKWTLAQCAHCARPDRKWTMADGSQRPDGDWCDECCDEGSADVAAK